MKRWLSIVPVVTIAHGILAQKISVSDRLEKRREHLSVHPGKLSGPLRTTPPESRNCYTMEADKALRARFFELGPLENFENRLQSEISKYQLRLARRRISQELVTIPVIVHVVHNGETVGAAANIPTEQVVSQIEILNQDFRRVGNGFNDHPDGADIEIEFALAVITPTGIRLEEPGVNRVDGAANLGIRLKTLIRN